MVKLLLRWLLLLVLLQLLSIAGYGYAVSQQLPQQQHNRYRQLQKWDAFNNIIYNAVINLPDTQMESAGLTLKVTQLKCTHLRVGGMSVGPRTPTSQEVRIITTIRGLDMDCTARYNFDGFLIVNGDGDLYVESLQNSAATETVFKSVDYSLYPPHDSYISSCAPTININNVDFSNGGFWGWTLDTLEGLFRGKFKAMAEARLCQELEVMANENMDALLKDVQDHLAEYPSTIVIDPLASEQDLMNVLQQQAMLGDEQVNTNTSTTAPTRLINWQEPDSYPFGFWMDQAWDDTVAFLNQPIELEDGTTDMNANHLLRQHVLQDGGILNMDLSDDVDQILYEGHDQWLHTKMKLHNVKVIGLDSLTLLEPLESIGDYTLQSKLSWESLSIELDVSIDLSPSTLPDSHLSAGSGTTLGIQERITVQFALSQVNADVAVLLALDQDLVEALQVGHFLDKDNILPCFLSSIFELEVSALAVEAIDLEPPKISGFVSQGLDSVISNAIQSAFLMYESTMLRSSKAFFQVAIRQVVNLALQAQYTSYGKTACQLWELSLPHSTVDVRDLLLAPNASIATGGAGSKRYGNLFADFVMPTLQREVLTDDNINERFLRPFSLDQSGEEGTLKLSPSAAPWVNFEQNGQNGTNWVALLGWNNFGFKAFDANVQNVDTITSPTDVLNPVEGNLLANNIRTGAETPDRPLRFSTRMTVWGEGIDDQVRDMANEIEMVLTVPSSMLSFDAEVAMNETALLGFPMKDLDNEFCWLSTLSQGTNQTALNMQTLITAFSSFALEIKCVSCSSPGGEAIPEIIETMEQANFTSLIRPHLEVLLAEATQGIWNNMNFPLMVQDAPKFCPHHPDYEPTAVVSDKYGVVNAMANSPQWSRQSLETISGIGLLSAYASLFVVAKNYLLNDVLQRTVIHYQRGVSRNQSLTGIDIDIEGIRLLDWTDLSASLGPWADAILDEARQALQDTVSIESVNAKRRLNIFESRSSAKSEHVNESRFLRANSWVRDYLLDDDGSMTFAFEDMQFDFAGISFSLLQARMHGVDTITALDPFIATGPRTLENNIQLDSLDVTLDMGVQMGLETHNMTVAFSFSDVAVELPLLLALDLDKMGEIKLESILKVNRIIACLLPGAHKVHIPKLSVSVGRLERPVIEGFLSPSVHSAVMAVNQGLYDSFGEELALALPGIFDTTIRRTLNTKLEQYVAQQDPTLCTVDAGAGVIDFRDLFLPESVSKSLGGSGKSPYGDLFQTVHHILNGELSTEGNRDTPSINSLLASWTADQSGVKGAMLAEDNLLETTAKVKIGGLDASIGFLLGDVSVLNIDSLGTPLTMLDPVGSDTLNNTLSFGIGPDPVKVAARLVISLTDGDEMQVRNEIEVRIDLYAATVIFTALLRIAEDSILSFPLKDIPNLHCWLATIMASSDDLRGVALTGHSFAMERLDLNVSCLSCTSPEFGDLVADLYAPTDAEDATNTVVQTFNQILDGEAIQDFFEQIVTDSSSKCPHSYLYDPSVSASASELLTAKPFGFTDFTERDSKSSYFNIANGIFAGCLLAVFIIGKVVIRHMNKKWKASLSREGMSLLRHQKARELEQEDTINLYSTSLFKSPHIPRNVRWLVPIAILINIGLYMGGHLGVLSTVDLEVQLAGEAFTVHHFIEFSFIKSTGSTYQNGGMEMSITLWIFTGIWPYVKLLTSLFLWFVPPTMLSVSTRGNLILWVDTLTKLSIVDIFTTILMLAVLLVYIGGPDEALSAEGALYSMKVIVIPGASCYCIIIAQRMSRVSSRFFLDNHDRVILAAREACARGDITDDIEEDASSVCDKAQAEEEEGWTGEIGSCQSVDKRTLSQQESQRPQNAAAALQSDHDQGSHQALVDDQKSLTGADSELLTGDKGARATIEEEERSARPSCWSKLSFLGVHLGVTFGGVTVLALLIIGCIYAPSVAVEVSDLWSLALESDTNFEEVVRGYGVFSVVSSVLLKSRFVLDTTWDYVALGFLMTVGFVAVGMTFFINCYHFFRRLVKEGWSAIRPSEGSTIYQLPSYLRLHAYKNIEIYVVAIVIGCWQLGSISIYAIHLYCSILDSVYRILAYIGLAEESSAECYQAQMAVPDNLLIFFGAFFVLMTNFTIQCTKQYRKNVRDACHMLQQEDHDVDHLSSLWNTQSTRSFWGGSRSQALKNNQTASFSEEDSSGDGSAGSNSDYVMARSSSALVMVEHVRSMDETVSLSTISGSPISARDLGSPGSCTMGPDSPVRSPSKGDDLSAENPSRGHGFLRDITDDRRSWT